MTDKWPEIERARQLQVSEQALLLELAHDAIFVRNTAGRITYWNQGAFETYGFTAEEALGKTSNELLQTEFPLPRDQVETVVQQAGRWDGELVQTCKDGRRIVTASRWAVQRTDDGQPRGFLEINRDVTEQKQAAEATRAAQRAAEDASRAKSEFLATMSHEIRTPMNGVLGMLGLLLETHLSTDQREMAEIARTSGEALLGIINDILDLSRIEAGRLSLEEAVFDLYDVAEDVAAMLAPRAREKRVDLVVRFGRDLPRFYVGDMGRLRQILVNLLGNSVKFTPQGHILVDVDAEVRTPTKALLRIRVEDTGIGIAPDLLDHIFDRFTQADSSTSRRFGGTGLGLAICRRLVELMDGTLRVESKLGEGSTFEVRLQLPVAAIALPESSRVSLESLAGVRVLVVDDNEVNRRVLHEQLIARGMRNGSSACGEEALEQLREAAVAGDPYRIALLDDDMPGMDGEALANHIQADPTLRDTRLIMLTSSARRGGLGELRKFGFVACLVKPVRQSQLVDALATAWGTYVTAGANERHVVVPAASTPVEVGGKHRILVVEDNQINAVLAVRILDRMGCHADVASDGRKAIDMLDQFPYDLVLMDCEMPEMNGYAAAAAIRKRPDGAARVPIVAVTAHALPGERERCLAAGMDDYVVKPLRRGDFESVVRRWCLRAAP